jgi:hypothetical protein
MDDIRKLAVTLHSLTNNQAQSTKKLSVEAIQLCVHIHSHETIILSDNFELSLCDRLAMTRHTQIQLICLSLLSGMGTCSTVLIGRRSC